jgi:hypothetical protein
MRSLFDMKGRGQGRREQGIKSTAAQERPFFSDQTLKGLSSHKLFHGPTPAGPEQTPWLPTKSISHPPKIGEHCEGLTKLKNIVTNEDFIFLNSCT